MGICRTRAQNHFRILDINRPAASVLSYTVVTLWHLGIVVGFSLVAFIAAQLSPLLTVGVGGHIQSKGAPAGLALEKPRLTASLVRGFE